MGNRIIESTKSFLSALGASSPALVEACEEKAATYTRERFPATLTLAESLDMMKAIKYISAIDGLSHAEAAGLHRLMERVGFPEPLLAHVELFDVTGLSFDDIAEIFPSGTLKAKQLIDGAIIVAMLDGYSDRERQTTIDIAARMGLRAEIVLAYEARIRLGNLIGDHSGEEVQKAK